MGRSVFRGSPLVHRVVLAVVACGSPACSSGSSFEAFDAGDGGARTIGQAATPQGSGSPPLSDGGGALTLASGQASPEAIAVDSTNVYWTNLGSLSGGTERTGGAVMKVPIGGGTPTTLAGVLAPANLAVDATDVYFATYGLNGTDCTVARVPTTGGNPVILASGIAGGSGFVALDSTSVYWSHDACDASGTSCNGAVMRTPKGGGVSTTMASGQIRPQGIAVDGTSVYWVNFGVNGNDGTVMKMPIGGGTPQTLASGQAAPSVIQVDSTSVYWTTFTVDGAIMRLPLGGGTTTTIASQQAVPTGIALDGTNAYWSAGGSRACPSACAALGRAPLAGGSGVTLLSGQPGPFAIALDETNIYWVDVGQIDGRIGTVMQMAKP
ncbi:MAG: hypothetical protein ACRENE_27140 [Polyangiaceae bacterium]